MDSLDEKTKLLFTTIELVEREKFSSLVTKYLGHHTAKELAARFECAISTVTRWANGFARPLPGMRKVITIYINKVRQQENW